jgi:hypothetical protein
MTGNRRRWAVLTDAVWIFQMEHRWLVVELNRVKRDSHLGKKILILEK